MRVEAAGPVLRNALYSGASCGEHPAKGTGRADREIQAREIRKRGEEPWSENKTQSLGRGRDK